MERITQRDLEILVDRINKTTNSPVETCTKNNTGSTPTALQRAIYSWNIGNYHLDYAYGGVKLVQTVNLSGGITDISRNGFGTKRELYNWMQAFLAGISQND